MSKAEERALKAYPIVMSQYSDNCKEYDSNESDRLTFIEGYHQAEKDLALTIEDIKQIDSLIDDVALEETDTMEDLYQEVLNQFNKLKEK